ncbi:hypothetical protein EJ05DRAFT_539405 [Pseudovirgaria hyperparasitica]|uniref:Rhodopsin domain-containing protein n=1 Tax=Pseudovirgaria hyperparasitica TaxID=470096 RepID=A0A6A6W5V8_9PEZI|nr:uncharacterized protein EJ05DRAFT_539405 [Pseudovirgaria hyperparasitica]KAF2756441.1 hypothetical protein EJ05DRAFT_539405 [Pseudovirgaria hyperparasitica]
MATLLLPRDRPTVTDDNLSAVVQILAILFLSFSIVAVAVEATTKRAISKRFANGDYVLFGALILCIAATSTLLSPAGRSVGNSIANVAPATAENAFRAVYAGAMLDVVALATIKVAMLFAFHGITPVKIHRYAIYAAGLVTLAWAISGLFVIGFQCDGPDRWVLGKTRCIELTGTRTYIAAGNILTDLALIAIPTAVISRVKLPLTKRLTLLSGFWVRLVVIGVTTTQIVFLQELNYADDNLLQNIWKVVICREAVQCSSIMTACIPFLKPFMGSLQSGFLRADDVKRRNAAGITLNGNESDWSSRYVEIQKQHTNSSLRLQSLTVQSNHSTPGTPQNPV